MSGFSADWLALRERYDRAARNSDLLRAVSEAMAVHSSITVCDLACGTGSTRRALAEVLPSRQRWRLYDNDLSLLARVAAPDVTPVPLDLGRDVEAALDGVVDLVTTSALLDLVSAEWLERLATELAVRNLPFYAALTYDGEIGFAPADDRDAAMVDAVNAHQRRDKGFGPALGPTAVQVAVAQFARVGYQVIQGKSDWYFAPDDGAIQRETLEGWAAAASEMGSMPARDIEGWLDQRFKHLDAGTSTLRVGHVDLFATPV